MHGMENFTVIVFQLCLFQNCQVSLYHPVQISIKFAVFQCGVCGQNSVVGIAMCSGLNSPGIKFWWGRDFLHLFRLALGPTQPPVQWILVLSGG